MIYFEYQTKSIGGNNMQTKTLKNLIKILEDSSLESLKYKDEKIEVELKKPSGHVVYEAPIQKEMVSQKADKIKTIDAPLVGVFYSKSSPDGPAFVSEGQSFKKGDVLCILEAMKVMNEIKATEDGVIKRVLIEDGEAVSFETPLFEIL